MKYFALILFMVFGYFIAEIVFRFILDPLTLGPRPVVAAVNGGVWVFIFGALGAKILNLKLN